MRAHNKASKISVEIDLTIEIIISIPYDDGYEENLHGKNGDSTEEKITVISQQ